MKEEDIYKAFELIFEYIGEDKNREGLRDTPKRVLQSWNTIFKGYKENPQEILGTVFEQGACDEMVILKGIEFYSTCEHHLLPFFGVVHIGYLPDKKVVGISKLARLTELFARRLQIQEQMTAQIADTLMNVLSPKGVMVVTEAKHMCMLLRGVQKQNSMMVTSALRGRFKVDAKTREEFMGHIKRTGL